MFVVGLLRGVDPVLLLLIHLACISLARPVEGEDSDNAVRAAQSLLQHLHLKRPGCKDGSGGGLMLVAMMLAAVMVGGDVSAGLFSFSFPLSLYPYIIPIIPVVSIV